MSTKERSPVVLEGDAEFAEREWAAHQRLDELLEKKRELEMRARQL